MTAISSLVPVKIFSLASKIAQAPLPPNWEATEKTAARLQLMGLAVQAKDPIITIFAQKEIEQILPNVTQRLGGIWNWQEGKGGLRPTKVAEGVPGETTFFFGQSTARMILDGNKIVGVPESAYVHLAHTLSCLVPE